MELVIGVAGLLLWLASSVVLANYDANNSLPKNGWRTTVVVLAWVNTLMFAILTSIASCSVSRGMLRAWLGRLPVHIPKLAGNA